MFPSLLSTLLVCLVIGDYVVQEMILMFVVDEYFVCVWMVKASAMFVCVVVMVLMLECFVRMIE